MREVGEHHPDGRDVLWGLPRATRWANGQRRPWLWGPPKRDQEPLENDLQDQMMHIRLFADSYQSFEEPCIISPWELGAEEHVFVDDDGGERRLDVKHGVGERLQPRCDTDDDHVDRTPAGVMLGRKRSPEQPMAST